MRAKLDVFLPVMPGKIEPSEANLAQRGLDKQVAMLQSEAQCFGMSVNDLQRAWQGEWPPGDVNAQGLYLEHVYHELTRRGRGDLCPI